MPSRQKALCGAKTIRGGNCSNYMDTCPHPSHRRAAASADASKPSASRPQTEVSAPNRPDPSSSTSAHKPKPPASGPERATRPDGRALADDPSLLSEMCGRASDHYGLAPALIEADYWLIRTLGAWMHSLGANGLPVPYRPAGRAASAGRIVFGGGTALSAAWNISDRWSEDIDLLLDPCGELTSKRMRAACKSQARRTCDAMGSRLRVLDTGPGYCFFESVHLASNQRTRVDVVARPLAAHASVLVQSRQVFSLLGRIEDQDVLDRYPELGGFTVPVLGPGLTMTDKLLAQTQVSSSGDLERIRERARDIYDLARIAKQRSRFAGHIGRDTRRLLHVSESQRHTGAPRRPRDGFASLRTFDPSTPEHEALAAGYETVLTQMVWGEKIPLDEAIRLIIALDEGPAEEHTE